MQLRPWNPLKTVIHGSNWETSTEFTKTGAEAAETVFELAKTLHEKSSEIKLETIKPLVEQISSLLDVLNAPLAQVIGSAIPFAPIAITSLNLIREVTKKEPSLESCIALISQVAYLKSLQSLLKEEDELVNKIGQKAVSAPVAQAIKKLGELEITEQEVILAIYSFHDSKLALAFNSILQQRLIDVGMSEAEAKDWTDRVARGTHTFLIEALIEVGESVKLAVLWYTTGGREEFEKKLSIDKYLKTEIHSKPDEKIFDEEQISFQDLYVSLNVRQLNTEGHPIFDLEHITIEDWAKSVLEKNSEKDKFILFIQGEPGRGKSVFCRMFADWISRKWYPKFIPIMIRLRELRNLANNLTDTLQNAPVLANLNFVQTNWLKDKNTRFLFLLDGFDELLLEGRERGGLKEFLDQVQDFQRYSHHRFLITGRPLALYGIERQLSQTQNLKRAAIEPMSNEIREIWLEKWAAKVGSDEVSLFKQFLQECPKEIGKNLAREPLLLYLLARMHREGRLSAQMFAGAEKDIEAKVRIYDEAVKWVLDKQRGNENLRLTGLATGDLRRFLREAALCVVQAGNENAPVAMLETRLKDSNDRLADLIKEARKESKLPEKDLLKNLLTAFYVKQASGDRGGSVEFTHKSFGEFLFAELLVENFEDWTRQIQRQQSFEDDTSRDVMDKQIYDLLGYGSLTPEVVSYLQGLLIQRKELNLLRLNERLQNFYRRWCDGEFIDVSAEKENLPQWKKEQLRKQLLNREFYLGLRQVDVYVGLNTIILLLELHRYANQNDTIEFDSRHLLQAMSYGQCLGDFVFNRTLGRFLYFANLSGANLSGANLSGANLSGADLSGADLTGADLREANFSRANLSKAELSRANFSRADLSEADLSGADLRGAYLRGAYLTRADLTRANLRGVYLVGSREADLSGADLSGAYLSGAYLREADLRLVQNLTQEQLAQSITDTNTQLPDDLM